MLGRPRVPRGTHLGREAWVSPGLPSGHPRGRAEMATRRPEPPACCLRAPMGPAGGGSVPGARPWALAEVAGSACGARPPPGEEPHGGAPLPAPPPARRGSFLRGRGRGRGRPRGPRGSRASSPKLADAAGSREGPGAAAPCQPAAPRPVPPAAPHLLRGAPRLARGAGSPARAPVINRLQGRPRSPERRAAARPGRPVPVGGQRAPSPWGRGCAMAARPPAAGWEWFFPRPPRSPRRI